MCGRFVYATQCDENQLAFPQVIFPNEIPLRYNIAPGQDITAIANTAELCADTFKWGLIPSWAKDHKLATGSSMRGEKPSRKNPHFARPSKDDDV